jgi:hypothetical protein
MADDIFKWIRNISSPNDEQLKQEIDLLPSKLLPEHLPKSDVPKLILTLFAMEHLQSTTLLIQSFCFFQLVNKLSLLSTPMSQSARSHTTLAL